MLRRNDVGSIDNDDENNAADDDDENDDESDADDENNSVIENEEPAGSFCVHALLCVGTKRQVGRQVPGIVLNWLW